MPWRERAAVYAAALWWGSLTAVGAWVVPLLFAHLATPAVAGNMAARLFAAQTWVAVGCGVLLLMVARGRGGDAAQVDWSRGALPFVAGGMLLALLAEFAVAPRIVARENLPLWHGLGTAMFALQWLSAGAVLWKVVSPVSSSATSAAPSPS